MSENENDNEAFEWNIWKGSDPIDAQSLLNHFNHVELTQDQKDILFVGLMRQAQYDLAKPVLDFISIQGLRDGLEVLLYNTHTTVTTIENDAHYKFAKLLCDKLGSEEIENHNLLDAACKTKLPKYVALISSYLFDDSMNDWKDGLVWSINNKNQKFFNTFLALLPPKDLEEAMVEIMKTSYQRGSKGGTNLIHNDYLMKMVEVFDQHAYTFQKPADLLLWGARDFLEHPLLLEKIMQDCPGQDGDRALVALCQPSDQAVAARYAGHRPMSDEKIEMIKQLWAVETARRMTQELKEISSNKSETFQVTRKL